MYVYDWDSRVTSITYANGVVTTNTWNATGRLMKVETKKSDSTLIERFEYTYDKAGNRLSVKLANGSTTSYEYDRLHRLTKMMEPGSVVTTYKYDAVGDLVEEKKGSTTQDVCLRPGRPAYGHHRLHGKHVVRLRQQRNRTWAFDKATAVNTSHSYDFENRMTARGTCMYTYAPNGERMSFACSAPTYYRYEAPSGAGFSDVAAEYDSIGGRQARYTHGPGVDEPVEQLRAGSYYTYQRDGLGSTSKITNAGQATVNAYTYSPWGDTGTSGSLANPFQFTGREADSGSSLYHYRVRLYDPQARRFVQKDPAGMCQGTNQYSYAGSNPVNRVDPSGMRFDSGGSGGGSSSGSSGGGSASGNSYQCYQDWSYYCSLAASLVCLALCGAFGWFFGWGPWGFAICGGICGFVWGGFCPVWAAEACGYTGLTVEDIACGAVCGGLCSMITAQKLVGWIAWTKGIFGAIGCATFCTGLCRLRG
jgi:RHS repeat-associated protein